MLDHIVKVWNMKGLHNQVAKIRGFEIGGYWEKKIITTHPYA